MEITNMEAKKKMSKDDKDENEKRIRHFIQTEVTEDYKEEFKEFAKRHGLKPTILARQCLNFFKLRDITPVEFVPKQEVSVDLSNMPDLTNIFNEAITPIMREITQIRDRMASIQEGFNSLGKDLRNVKEDVTSEVSTYVTRVRSEIKALREKLLKEGE